MEAQNEVWMGMFLAYMRIFNSKEWIVMKKNKITK
jgi:hypothetical protein